MSKCGGPSGLYARWLQKGNDELNIKVASGLGLGLIKNKDVEVVKEYITD